MLMNLQKIYSSQTLGSDPEARQSHHTTRSYGAKIVICLSRDNFENSCLAVHKRPQAIEILAIDRDRLVGEAPDTYGRGWGGGTLRWQLRQMT